MAKSHKFGIICLVVCIISLFGFYEIKKHPPAVSAATNTEPATISLADLMLMLGSGTGIATIASFLKANSASLISVRDSLGNLIPHSTATTAVPVTESVASAIALAANPKDIPTQFRYVNAQMSVIRDALQDKPTLAAPLNTLAVAIANVQYPVAKG